MKIEEAIAHIDNSIERAVRGESYLDPAVLEIKGFSTDTQRHLVSNLARGINNYLEVGLFHGATFCAAMSNNPHLTAHGFEDFSQDFGDQNIDSDFQDNFYIHGTEQSQLYLHDCFDAAPLLDIKEINLFNYDGSHDFESQAKALPHFIDCMADVFIFLVDDYAWQSVADGTSRGFQDLGSKVSVPYIRVMTDGKPDGPRWHNDVFLAVVEKKP